MRLDTNPGILVGVWGIGLYWGSLYFVTMIGRIWGGFGEDLGKRGEN